MYRSSPAPLSRFFVGASADPDETLYVSRHACASTTINLRVFSFSSVVFGILGACGTRSAFGRFLLVRPIEPVAPPRVESDVEDAAALVDALTVGVKVSALALSLEDRLLG